MNYAIEFKPKSIKDLKKIQAALDHYEDLKLLRQAKLEEANSPTISLREAKSIFKIKTPEI